MRITLYRHKPNKIGGKLLQYDTKYKKYVIRFFIKSDTIPTRYTLSDNLNDAIKLIKEGYH